MNPRAVFYIGKHESDWLLTGIQHFTRNFLLEISQSELVFAFARFDAAKLTILGENEAEALVREMIALSDSTNQNFHLNSYSEQEICASDIVYFLDLDLDKRFIAKLKEVQTNGIRTRFFVHDVLPLTHKRFFPQHFVEDFENYISAVGHSDGFASSCLFTAEECSFVLRKFPVGKRRPGIIPIAPNKFPSCQTDCVSWDIKEREFIICVSNFEPRKNHETLLKAFNESDLRHDHSLVLVGGNSWMSEHIEFQIEELNQMRSDSVIKLNGIPSCCVGTLYKHAKFSVYPSEAEGYGMPIIESLACGTPVLTNSKKPMKDLVVHSHLLSIDMTNYTDLVLELNRLLIVYKEAPANISGELPTHKKSIEGFLEWHLGA